MSSFRTMKGVVVCRRRNFYGVAKNRKNDQLHNSRWNMNIASFRLTCFLKIFFSPKVFCQNEKWTKINVLFGGWRTFYEFWVLKSASAPLCCHFHFENENILWLTLLGGQGSKNVHGLRSKKTIAATPWFCASSSIFAPYSVRRCRNLRFIMKWDK